MKKVLVVGTGIGSDGGTGRCLYELLKLCNEYVSDFEYYVALQNDESLEILNRDFPKLHGIKILTSSNRPNIIIRLLFFLGVKYPFYLFKAKQTKMILKGVEYKAGFDKAISYSSIPSFLFVYTGIMVRANSKIAWQHSNLSRRNQKFLERKSVMKQRCLFLYNRCVKKFDAFIGVSNGTINDLVKIYPSISRKAKTIHNFYTNVISSKNDYKSDLNILSVGRITVEKGIDLAIKAAVILQKNNLNFKWTFVGDGYNDLPKNIIKTIKKKHLQEHIVFAGFQKETSAFYLNSSLFCLTSRLEGYPTVLNEAKSYGLPIISTNVSGATDILESGRGGGYSQLQATFHCKGNNGFMEEQRII